MNTKTASVLLAGVALVAMSALAGCGKSADRQESGAPPPPLPPAATAPASTPRAAASTAASSTASVIVTGTIKDLTKPPTPGSVPYKDAIVELDMQGVKAAGGGSVGPNCLAYVWGMKNNKLTAAAGYAKGRKVTLAPTKWDKVSSKYDSYQRVDLSTDDATTLDEYWGEIK